MAKIEKRNYMRMIWDLLTNYHRAGGSIKWILMAIRLFTEPHLLAKVQALWLNPAPVAREEILELLDSDELFDLMIKIGFFDPPTEIEGVSYYQPSYQAVSFYYEFFLQQMTPTQRALVAYQKVKLNLDLLQQDLGGNEILLGVKAGEKFHLLDEKTIQQLIGDKVVSIK